MDPIKKEVREGWLRELLQIEKFIQEEGPVDFREYRIITDAELIEIRRIWLEEKYEFEDTLPQIYLEIKGKEFDLKDKPIIFGNKEYNLLKKLCNDKYKDEELLFSMIAGLLELERREFSTKYRNGFWGKLENIIEQCYYRDEEDALGYIKSFGERKEEMMKNLLDLDEHNSDMEEVDINDN